MATIPTVNPKNALGLADKVIGLGKEVAGEVFGRDSLREAGEAQQTKGTEKLKALRAEAEAETHKKNAETQKKRQKAASKA